MSKQKEVTINYIQEFRIKNDAKKIKYYEISKNYSKLSANSPAMIKVFL